VILFHAGFELFSGGFVGVDVFFVISGYLITSILIDDIENKRFSIVNFYERRARRILPALYTLLIFSALYGLYTSPFYARDIFQSIFATTLFSENLLLIFEESNYFEIGTDEKLLFHTWSLAVEEQYYLLFPIFLMLVWRFGKNKVFWLIFGLAIISLFLSEWGWRNQPSANFYLVFTRAWELLAGSIAAFIVLKRGVKKSNVLAFLGLSAIIFSILFYNKNTPFPSVYALMPVLGVVLLVLYANKETVVAKLLSIRPFVGIGLISYSAYLWHQPLIVMLNRETNLFTTSGDLDAPKILVFCLTIIIAAASYYLIEQPFRYKTERKHFIFLFSFLTVIILTVSFFGHKTVGYMDQKLRFTKYPSLHIDHFKNLNAVQSTRLIDKDVKMPRVLVIGDSMALDFVRALSTNGLFGEYKYIDGVCFKGITERGYDCGFSLNEIKSKVVKFDYVFLATDYNTEKSLKHSLKLYSALAEVANVYFVNSFHFRHASDLSYFFATGRKEYSKESIYDSLRKAVHISNQEISTTQTIKILDKYSYFCNDKKQECLLYSDSGQPLRYDEIHLTIDGMDYYGDKIIESLCSISNKFCEYRWVDYDISGKNPTNKE